MEEKKKVKIKSSVFLRRIGIKSNNPKPAANSGDELKSDSKSATLHASEPMSASDDVNKGM